MSKKTDKQQDAAPGTAMKLAEDAIRKKFGDAAVIWASGMTQRVRSVISTGSLGLDYALGVGGVESGRMVEVFGPPASGKSTLAMSLIANAHRISPKGALYVDVERGINLRLADTFGADRSRLAVISSATAEQNVEIAETYIKTGEFSICVVDSVAALVPAVQYEASIEDQFMGVHARFMSRVCPLLKSVASATDTAVVFINQIRFKIGSYGNPETNTGGNALPFYADVRIRVSGGDTKGSRIEDASGEIVGHINTFDIVKNKFSTPFRSAKVDLVYGVGYDAVAELVSLGEEMGLVSRQGAWYFYKEGKWQGRDALRKAVRETPELAAALKADVVSILEH